MWLIGDTEERPGQTRCTREGSLCQWACPHCGHQGEEGAPILLCRPEEDPRLL